MNEGISSLVERLIFSGKNTEKVTINDLTFEMSSLTEGEVRTMMSNLYLHDEDKRQVFMKSFGVAASLRSVNEVSIETLAAEQDGETLFDKKVNLVQELQVSLVSKLFGVFDRLNKGSGITDEQVEEIKN